MAKKKAVVGMSGGVDSSVAAYLLKQDGYEVIGLFMRNWHEEDDSGACTAEADYADVRRVAALLDIPYYTVDLSRDYQERVFSLFVEEYKRGRTPNPDVLCNREIKFGSFKEHALKLGADAVATGHYAGVLYKDGETYLTRAKDENKDQTYFLNQVTNAQLQNALFPLSEITKPAVREIAKKLNFSTAEKKDSTGVCFIGERDFRRFLSRYIPMQEGNIKTLDGKIVGKHNGVFYYTVGQRKGFGVGGGGNGAPYYVVKKDVANNVLYVNQGDTPLLYAYQLTTEPFHYINRPVCEGQKVLIRVRHRQPLVKGNAFHLENGGLKLTFEEPIRAVAEGQYAVIYENNICLGGGVILCAQ
jgi:tRNA-specific 2-thiouridylase